MEVSDPLPLPADGGPAIDPPAARGQRGRDPVLAAAAGALGLVALTQAALPAPTGTVVDAIVNEWIIWFLGLYLTLRGAEAVMERVRRAPRWRVRGAADVHPTRPRSAAG